jgi:hypothetical protein
MVGKISIHTPLCGIVFPLGKFYASNGPKRLLMAQIMIYEQFQIVVY